MVPVEEWEERQEEETEIDLVELAKHIWSKRIFIAKVTGVFVVIGLLVAFLSPVEYETAATLMPETQNQSVTNSLLQQYGGLLGMSGGIDMSQEGTISPQLYPKIVESLPFQLRLLNERVRFSEFDTTVTVYQFFKEVHTPSFFSNLSGYTIGLPGKIIGLFKPESPEQPLPKGFEPDSVFSVTQNQMEIIEGMRERVVITLTDENGLIELTVEMPDPTAAAELGRVCIKLIKEYVINYRTHKAKEDLKFAQEQFQVTKKRFQEAQNQLAEFRDSNVNLATARARTQEERLQSEYDLAFNVYNTLAQKVEQAKLKVQEQTPVMSMIKPVQVPIDKSSPQRRLIFIIFTLLGIIVSVGSLILKYLWYKNRVKFSESRQN